MIVASLAAPLAACGGARSPDAGEAQRAVDHRLYWVGSSFEGLPLTAITRLFGLTTFVYGSCKPAGQNESCAPPLEISVASICDRNALTIDLRPRTRSRARGVPVLDYDESRLELAAGASQVVVSASRDRARRAIAELRAVGERGVRGDLPEPRYPRYYLGALRRVSHAYARTGSVRAVRDELGISRSAVRFRLALGRELGAARLRLGDGEPRRHACALEPAR